MGAEITISDVPKLTRVTVSSRSVLNLIFFPTGRIILVFGLVAMLCTGAHANGAELFKEGQPLAKIYVSPEDAKPVDVVVKKKPATEPNALSKAIEDLNYHFEKMTGKRLEVVQEADPSKVTQPALVLGHLAEKLGATVTETRWKESYRILVKDQRVLINGESLEAVSYGIYDFLGQLGCDWVIPGKLGEIIPAKPTLSVADLDRKSQPDFGLRWMWIGGGPKYMKPEQAVEFELWKTRQRMGYAWELRRRISEAHMWQAVVAKYKEEFAKHPEMYALVKQPDGTYARKGPQLETTNPMVIDLVVRFIKEKFEQEGWPKDEKVTLAVGPADGLDFSESPESLAAGANRKDPVLGASDVSDLVAKLANDVLEKIVTEYPNLSLSYYIYSAHEEFPARYTPNPRIFPIFAPINYSRLHSTVDTHSKTRAYYKTIVEQWAELSKKQGNPLMVYEYNWNLADNLLPFTRLKSMAEDLQYYHSKGFIGVTVQAIKASAINGPHDYIFAKMSWDTSLDWKKVFHEYCERSFGAAAGDLERYYLRLADRQQVAGQEAGSYFAAPLIFDDEFMKASQQDIQAALDRKDLTTDEKGRVDAVVFGFESLRLYLAWNAAMNSFDFAKAKEQGDALQGTYDKMAAANPFFTGREAGIYIQRLLMNSTREALKYASAPYGILYKLPDELPTLFDPGNCGERMNIFGKDINDSGWVKTRTYTSTWDAQGLGFLRDVSVWYRTRFKAPENLNGGGVGLLLSAFEDEALIWVNGKFVGTSGIKYPTPAVFDLTDAIEPGKENLLTIEIKRNSMANETGLGGILRPGFVFTGPRVEAPAEKDDGTQQRVLPGGDIEKVKTEAPAKPQ
ncbi:hypothetical protein BH09VER1_BH09VER1_25390 [soil metagenome]